MRDISRALPPDQKTKFSFDGPSCGQQFLNSAHQLSKSRSSAITSPRANPHDRTPAPPIQTLPRLQQPFLRVLFQHTTPALYSTPLIPTSFPSCPLPHPPHLPTHKLPRTPHSPDPARPEQKVAHSRSKRPHLTSNSAPPSPIKRSSLPARSLPPSLSLLLHTIPTSIHPYPFTTPYPKPPTTKKCPSHSSN